MRHNDANADYRLEIKVKNNNILRMIEQSGYSSVGEFCRLNNKLTWQSTIGKLVNLKKSPLNTNGSYLKIIHEICDILLCSPEDLFSDHQLTTELESNKRTIRISEAELKFTLTMIQEPLLLEDQIAQVELIAKVQELVETLPPREQKIIKMRFGIGGYKEPHTLDEVSKEFNVTRERIRMIESKAIKRMRLPSRHEMVASFLEP